MENTHVCDVPSGEKHQRTMWVSLKCHGWMTAMELSETAMLLYKKYGTFTLGTKQLAAVLHYKTTRVLLNAISAETCPVRTFKIGKLRVADIRDIAAYLDKRRFG